jgi:hypothetical protein
MHMETMTKAQQSELAQLVARFPVGARVVALRAIHDEVETARGALTRVLVASPGEYGEIIARYPHELPTVRFASGHVIDCTPDEIEVCSRKRTVRG